MIDILIYGLVYIFLLGFLNWSRPAPVAPKATPKGPKQKVRMGRSPAMNLGLKNAGWSRNDHFTSGHTHTHTQTHTHTDRQTDIHTYIYIYMENYRKGGFISGWNGVSCFQTNPFHRLWFRLVITLIHAEESCGYTHCTPHLVSLLWLYHFISQIKFFGGVDKALKAQCMFCVRNTEPVNSAPSRCKAH